jgi:hypothetical protein
MHSSHFNGNINTKEICVNEMSLNVVIVKEMRLCVITASKMTEAKMNVDEIPLDNMSGNNDCRINDILPIRRPYTK